MEYQTIPLDTKTMAKIAIEFTNDYYAKCRREDIEFYPTDDLMEFHIPAFTSTHSDGSLYRTNLVKSFSENGGYKDIGDFWKFIIATYAKKVNYRNIDKACAMLSHLKKTFAEREYHYYCLTKPLKEEILELDLINFENDESHELLIKLLYSILNYEAFFVLEFFQKKNINTEYNSNIGEWIEEFKYYGASIVDVGIRISALKYCIDFYLLPNSFLTNSQVAPGLPTVGKWDAFGPMKYFGSFKFKNTGNPFKVKKVGRPIEESLKPEAFKALVKEKANLPEFQHPDGRPKPKRIAEDIHFGKYTEKGSLGETSIFNKVKIALNEIENEELE